jgi:hypothetical protein
MLALRRHYSIVRQIFRFSNHYYIEYLCLENDVPIQSNDYAVDDV